MKIKKHGRSLELYMCGSEIVSPSIPPEVRLEASYTAAVVSKKRVYAFRLLRILDQCGLADDASLNFTEDNFQEASSATLVWMGEKLGKENPELARDAFQGAIDRDVESKVALDAIYSWGLLEEDLEDYDEALELYQRAIDEFPGSDIESDVFFSRASAFYKKDSFDDAVEVYESIISRKDWRGQSHARALYQIGLMEYEQEVYPRAHGYFERTYIAYGFFKEWSSRAYLMSGKALMKMGRNVDARSTFGEFLEDESYRDTLVYEEIEKHYSKLK